MLRMMIAAIATALLAATPGLALTVTNRDSKEHSIGLDMGGKESVHKIAPGQSMTFKDECKDGCGVTGPWDFSKMAKPGDSITIDGKSLIYR